MSLIGKRIRHKSFGEGIIRKEEDGKITVDFEKNHCTKILSLASCLSLISFPDDADNLNLQEIMEVMNAQKKISPVFEENSHQSAAYRNLKSVEIQSRSSANLHCTNVHEFVETYKAAILKEMYWLKEHGGKRYKVFDGKYIEYKSGAYIYSFEAESELNIPDGSSITIHKNFNQIDGNIIGCEDYTVILSSSENLGKEIPLLEFSADPWILLSKLADRLDEIEKRPTAIVEDLITNGHKNSDTYQNIATGQTNAVEMAMHQPITFIWGPPGTGKTETLARIALKHIQTGNRVLMLSYSNVSVDEAIMRVNKLYEKKKPGDLIRYGYPRKKELLSHPYLTAFSLSLYNNKDLLAEKNELSNILQRTARTSKEYVDAISKIQALLAEQQKESVKKAKFVATTVSKAVVDSTIRNAEFDVVIFDEASMAYIPQVIYSSSLAKKHFICMGDFKQLPPIVQSGDKSNLNADIFQFCGISDAVNAGYSHRWLCMLDTQYRMHPDIAAFSSQYMYKGLLKSDKAMKDKRANIASISPIEGVSLGFADLSGMMSVCTKTSDESRVNVLSAFISFALAVQAAQKSEVGIITPYKSQSRLLHAMVRDLSENGYSNLPISCATVHQFQGSEKDIIIYDAVDCYRMSHPGVLLSSTSNDYANRLFNVALTRARGKFIGVSNISYMENKGISSKLLFGKMIQKQRNSGSCIHGEYFTQESPVKSGGLPKFLNPSNENQKFIKDIETAKKEVRIDIPGTISQENSINDLVRAINAAKSRGVKVTVRAEKKTSLPGQLRTLSIENAFVANPIAIIDKSIIWFGMPHSSANFIPENRVLPTKFRPIIRYVGQHTALSIYAFLEMEQTMDQSKTADIDDQGNLATNTLSNYILATRKCTKCGKPLRIQKGKTGTLFLGCTGYPNCKSTEILKQELIDKYLYSKSDKGTKCPKCGYSLEAAFVKGKLKVRCCGLMQHLFNLEDI